EFNGRWNNTKEDRVRYREKKEVYSRNNLPCIYLYPENLGIIDFVFSKRLIEVLLKNNMTKQLRRFQFKRFIDDRGGLFVYMFVSAFVYSGSFTWQENYTTLSVCIGVFVYQIYRLVMG
ncbi:hypothetical protein IU405_08620, partial [Polaribacter sp. BAL334]|uniref:hypothetical protein n=1 Tax=Polaribacter sp. BAL334 TaxID=1708178 RepID=UPI0018D1FD9F